MNEPNIHIVSVSGGRTSGYLVHKMEQKRKDEGWDVRYIFMDTGAEHPNTYQFIKNIVKNWKIDLICIRTKVHKQMGIGVTYEEIGLEDLKPDLQPWKDMLAKYGTPTINTPFCTSRMKQEPHDKYCDDKFGRGNYITWLGIRADEPNRLKHFVAIEDMFNKQKEMVRPIRYLAELCQKGKEGINEWWRSQPFDLDLEPHQGNCVFCVKKTEVKLWAAAAEEPEMAEEFNSVLMDPSVRRLENAKYPPGVIYRGHLSIGEVIRLSKVLAGPQLTDQVAAYNESEIDDPTFCSESCEIFSGQIDMFNQADVA